MVLRLRSRREKEREGGGSIGSATSAMALATTSNSTALINPADAETKLSVKNGLMWGESTRNEVAAYLLDHEHSAGVPPTVAAYVYVPTSTASAGSSHASKKTDSVFATDEDEEDEESGSRDEYDDDSSYSVTTSGVHKSRAGKSGNQHTEKVLTYGSLQEYVPNMGSAEDMGDSRFSVDSVHRIGVLGTCIHSTTASCK